MGRLIAKDMTISSQDSQVISLLRLPLAALVVFVHLNPATTCLYHTNWDSWSLASVFEVIEISISYVIALASIPGFYFISGFLFFLGFRNWNIKLYLNKLKKRALTLLSPFVCWNIISILSFILFYVTRDFFCNQNYSDTLSFLSTIDIHTFWDCNSWGSQKINWLGVPIPSTGPFAITLWFIRDLIVVCLFAPVLWCFFRKFGRKGLFFLLICYISKIWVQIPGFSIDAFFFFGAGGYISTNEKSLSELATRYHRLFYYLTSLSFPLCVYFGGQRETIGFLLFPFFAIGFVGILIYWGTIIVKTTGRTIPSVLIQGCMFVYTLHALPLAHIGSPLSFIGSFMARLLYSIPGSQIIIYFITPIITIVFCLTCHYIVRRVSPTLCVLLTGKK